MALLRDSSLDQEKLQTVLETSCDALMMLQSMDRGHGATDNPQAYQHLLLATESLRSTIAELRLARDEEASVVGLGFVVRGDARHLPSRPRVSAQARPRRTA
jgi:hypothetical protein